jgi:hypothetical protein
VGLLNTLKKLKGDKLGFRRYQQYLQTIGLGPTEPWRYPCNFAVVILLGQYSNHALFFLGIHTQK